MESKNILANVSIIRPILIVLLVFYHAFAIYGGAWTPLEGYPEVEAYWWLDKFSYAFMLESFVFVSGYVFGYQVRTKGVGKLDAKSLFWSKFKRLIIPSMIFSLLYILILGNIRQSVVQTLYGIINGEGHMWFLPMLFWCFVAVWTIEKLKLGPRLVIPLLLVLAICSIVPLPLRLSNAQYYALFFYVGYILQRNNVGFEQYYSSRNTIFLIVLFIISFVSLTIFKKNIGGIIQSGGRYLFHNQFIAKAIQLLIAKVATIVYSSIGLAMLFVAVGTADKSRKTQLPQWITNVGGLCMGVYLFQQFILKLAYYHTGLPYIVGPYLLPWVAFIIALLMSLLLSYLLHTTRFGRELIG